MPEEKFDDLLKRMQGIAQAVNQFKSETVQQQAFEMLMRVSGVETGRPNPQETGQEDAQDGSGKSTKTSQGGPSKSTSTANKPKRGNSSKPTFINDLNLRPQGKESLKDFADAKKPKTNEEKFAVIIYYLQRQLGVKSINSDHIYTAFKELGVKVPADINDAIFKCASRKGWIDTADSSNLTVTVRGENFVEHDLPDEDKK